MSEGQKEIIEHLQTQVRDLKLSSKVCAKQNRGFKAIIENRNQALSLAESERMKAEKKVKQMRRRILIWQAVAVTAHAITIYILVR